MTESLVQADMWQQHCACDAACLSEGKAFDPDDWSGVAVESEGLEDIVGTDDVKIRRFFQITEAFLWERRTTLLKWRGTAHYVRLLRLSFDPDSSTSPNCGRLSKLLHEQLLARKAALRKARSVLPEPEAKLLEEVTKLEEALKGVRETQADKAREAMASLLLEEEQEQAKKSRKQAAKAAKKKRSGPQQSQVGAAPSNGAELEQQREASLQAHRDAKTSSDARRDCSDEIQPSTAVEFAEGSAERPLPLGTEASPSRPGPQKSGDAIQRTADGAPRSVTPPRVETQAFSSQTGSKGDRPALPEGALRKPATATKRQGRRREGATASPAVPQKSGGAADLFGSSPASSAHARSETRAGASGVAALPLDSSERERRGGGIDRLSGAPAARALGVGARLKPGPAAGDLTPAHSAASSGREAGAKEATGAQPEVHDLTLMELLGIDVSAALPTDRSAQTSSRQRSLADPGSSVSRDAAPPQSTPSSGSPAGVGAYSEAGSSATYSSRRLSTAGHAPAAYAGAEQTSGARRWDAGELEDMFSCPITQELMLDPVLAEDGFTYERAAIEEWIRKRGSSPMTDAPLSVARLEPNRLAKQAVTYLFT